MKSKFQAFAGWMNSLKHDKKALIILIAIDLMMAVFSNIADWPWLMSVPTYVIPFTPICSLYPLTLAIWFLIYYKRKKVPAWFTTFIYIGIMTYGFMAYVYYPLYMAWSGMHWRLFGNMLWVTAYALQSFIIASELRPLKIYQYLLIIGYFYFKDFSDRYLGSFIDILQPGFPESLKNGFFVTVLSLHAVVITLTVRRSRKNSDYSRALSSNSVGPSPS